MGRGLDDEVEDLLVWVADCDSDFDWVVDVFLEISSGFGVFRCPTTSGNPNPATLNISISPMVSHRHVCILVIGIIPHL